jgi:hypothetical protein
MQFILECIEINKTLPALWDIQCKEYSNRQKKNGAYDILVVKYRERNPEAGREDVKKISFPTNFRKEVKRLKDLKKSGAGAEVHFHGCTPVFSCTNPSANVFSSSSLYSHKTLKQWPHKQRQCHSAC